MKSRQIIIHGKAFDMDGLDSTKAGSTWVGGGPTIWNGRQDTAFGRNADVNIKQRIKSICLSRITNI